MLNARERRFQSLHSIAANSGRLREKRKEVVQSYGEPDEDKDARAAAHMQDRIAMIHWEEGDCGKNYFCYDLDRDDSSDDPGVFFYGDGSVKDLRHEVKQSEWVVEKRGDKYWVHMR